MTEKSEEYLADIKSKFVNGYDQYLNSNDISDFIHNIVIPNFDIIACDLEELIDSINQTTENKNQVIDYIELIFNSKLYDSILEVLKENNEKESFVHYLIILIEFVKWEKYQKIKSNLSNYNTNYESNTNPDSNPDLNPDNKQVIIFDVLNKATDERAQYCMDKIRSTYKDLITNYSNYANCIDVCENLLESNNINLS